MLSEVTSGISEFVLHQEKLKRTLRHLVTLVYLIKLNKVDSEGDLLNLSQNVLKMAYLRLQGALSLVKYVVKTPNWGNLLKLPDLVAVYDQFISQFNDNLCKFCLIRCLDNILYQT